MSPKEYQEKIILEKYNMMIQSCSYYPNCLPECNGMEMCNHIIDRAKIAMILKHNKTGNLYYLGSEKCKAKINGEWVDAVLYRGWEKKTGEYYYFVREKSDFESHFTLIGDAKTGYNLTSLQKQLSVLKEVAEEYPGKTIENIIVQLEARLKEVDNAN